MTAKTVMCAKLGRELPAIDATTSSGRQALKMCRLMGGPELAARVQDQVSGQAWEMWTDHMRMIMNEYRLDPSSDEANVILRKYMEDFFFGQERAVPNYVPPPGDKKST